MLKYDGIGCSNPFAILCQQRRVVKVLLADDEQAEEDFGHLHGTKETANLGRSVENKTCGVIPAISSCLRV